MNGLKRALPELCVAALLALTAGVGLAQATGSVNSPYAQMQYRDEGNTRDLFNVSCSSTAWTTLISSQPVSRQVIFMALESNTDGVCLSSATSSNACDDSKKGPELEAGSSLTDYGILGWTCRSRANSVGRIKGYRSRHSSDNPNR